ncbi:MAG: hypothetical protein ACREGD_04785 [Candidatus Saccharimonadales bacterium]
MNEAFEAKKSLSDFWLERRFTKITFDPKDIDCDVQEIRELLDDSANDNTTKP